jgi:hypothetical protein
MRDFPPAAGGRRVPARDGARWETTGPQRNARPVALRPADGGAPVTGLKGGAGYRQRNAEAAFSECAGNVLTGAGAAGALPVVADAVGVSAAADGRGCQRASYRPDWEREPVFDVISIHAPARLRLRWSRTARSVRRRSIPTVAVTVDLPPAALRPAIPGIRPPGAGLSSRARAAARQRRRPGRSEDHGNRRRLPAPGPVRQYVSSVC